MMRSYASASRSSAYWDSKFGGAAVFSFHFAGEGVTRASRSVLDLAELLFSFTGFFDGLLEVW